jgi:hypothetical protein
MAETAFTSLPSAYGAINDLPSGRDTSHPDLLLQVLREVRQKYAKEAYARPRDITDMSPSVFSLQILTTVIVCEGQPLQPSESGLQWLLSHHQPVTSSPLFSLSNLQELSCSWCKGGMIPSNPDWGSSTPTHTTSTHPAGHPLKSPCPT